MAELKMNLLFVVMVASIAALAQSLVGDLQTLTITNPTGCGAFANGLTLLTCESTYTTVAQVQVLTPVGITRTTTITLSATLTLTRTISLVRPQSPQAVPTPPALTTTTAFCYNTKHADILEPCTRLIEPTSRPKGNAANLIANPFKTVTHYVKKLTIHAKRDEDKGQVGSSSGRCYTGPFLLMLGAGLLTFDLLLLYLKRYEILASKSLQLVISAVFLVFVITMWFWLAVHFHWIGSCEFVQD